MSIYYVTHPNLGVSAKVEAPATEKARTTFLDYLERHGHINRADRQHWRRNMVAEKMEYPEDVFADIELHYGYEEAPRGYRPSYEDIPVQLGRPGVVDIPVGFEEPEVREIPVSFERPELLEEEESQQPTRQDIGEVAQEAPRRLSPIQKLALRGYVG